VTEAAGSKRRYALFVKRGSTLTFSKLRDEGVGIDGGLLFWQSGQREIARPLTDIVSVNLTTIHLGDLGDCGQCVISFAGVQALVVSGSAADRHAETGGNAVYRDFVRDLHASLIAAGHAGAVRFSAGMNLARIRFLKVMLAILGLAMVVLPIGLMLWTGELGLLGGTAFGIVFVWGYYNVARRNQPRSYEPGAIPPDLLP
jgi:hypothetical protein